jgi:enoyl-CoA hydratase/carnithine racemase
MNKHFETVEYETRGKVGYITMNRPDKHNALNYQLLDDLDAAFDYAEADDSVNVVVLRGAGRSFCSGYDMGGSYYISVPKGHDHWDMKNSLMTLRSIEARYQRIWNFPKATIAQVHGHCIAGGCYLQLVCDISVAADDASFDHRAQRVGGVSSMPLWQVVMGPKRARYLLFTGRAISGKQAADWGLVSLSVPSEQLQEMVDKIADEIAGVPQHGLLQNKEVLNTDLEIMGVGAMFRYHGQHNALGRVVSRAVGFGEGVTSTEKR